MKNLIATILFFVITSYSVAQVNLDSGLVAYFPFNGNANDETGNGNNGIITNAILAADRFNHNDRAFYFNGTNARIEIPHNNSLNINNDISISVWIKPEEIQTSGNRMILGKSNYSDATNYIFRLRPNAVLQWEYYTSLYTNSNSLTADSWYHLVLTADSTTGNKQIYINGELILDQVVAGSGPYGLVTNPLTIGAAKYFGTSWAEFFKGTIDEVRIYNRILDSTEVAALFQDSTTYSGDRLIAYFPFNGNALDVTGNGYDGTINGNAALVPDRFNLSDKAFTFPDQSSSVSIANSTNLNLENGFTLNAWIKYKSGGTKVIICKHVCGYVNGFIFWIDTDGQLKLLLGQSGWSVVGTNQTFVEDAWYMVTATYDSGTSTAKVYVDGQLAGNGSVAYNNFSPNPVSIGESYQNNCVAGNMDGAVDEVKIYNRPLSDAEILDEYNNTYNDLVLFLPFNGNANDESGSGNNGTVNGASLTQDRFGINDRAYQFDGSNDYISIADNPNLFSDELTISWWYKLTETPGAAWVVIGWVDGGHRYQQFFSGGQLSYLNGYNVNQPGLLFNPIYGLNDLNVWKNVVVTYKKLTETTSTTSIYVDGELKQTDNHTVAMDYVPGIEFKIGKNVNGNFFKGSLDDFRIYNRILDSSEVLALYHDSTTFFGDSLIAYFPFNGNANDESFLQNNGTAINALLTNDRYGDADKAYYFNGSDSRIQVPENSFYSFGTGEFTISSWVNASEIRTARIVSAGFHQNDGIWGLGFGAHPVWGIGNRINYFVFSDGGYRDFSSDEIIDYSPGQWIFVAAAKSGNEIKFYTNGSPAGSVAINYPSNANSYLSIGCRQYNYDNLIEFFNGKIDEVKIFNKALSDQQINDMYKTTTTAPNLIFPGKDSTISTLTPVMDWDSLVTATNYTILIATDSLFNSIILSQFSNQSSYSVESGALTANIDYFWKVRTNNDGGIGPWSEISKFRITLTDVENENNLPREFVLMQNYPNPFNPVTKIKYTIPASPNPSQGGTLVQLKVYDVLGNEVTTLVNEYKPAGSYEVEFNVAHESLRSSGVYFYQIKAGEYLETKKMILIK